LRRLSKIPKDQLIVVKGFLKKFKKTLKSKKTHNNQTTQIKLT